MCVVVVVLLLLHAWRIGRSRNNTNSHASSFFDARLFRVEAARTSTRRCFPFSLRTDDVCWRDVSVKRRARRLAGSA